MKYVYFFRNKCYYIKNKQGVLLFMALSYEPLWRQLKQLNLSKMDLVKKINISNATLAKLGKNEPVTLTIIEKICDELHCNINNVVTYIPEKPNNIPIDQLQIGTVILCPSPSLRLPIRERISKTHDILEPHTDCVILRKRNISSRECNFFVAPLNYRRYPDNIFDVHFTSEHSYPTRSGNIILTKCSTTKNSNIAKIEGNISLDLINSINSGILLDMVSIMLKYQLVSEALLYNAGFEEEELNNLKTRSC